MWGTLSGISYREYYQQKRQDSSTKDVSVKEDDSLKLTRSQDYSAYIKCDRVAGYDWEYLIVERNCVLAVSFRIFIYRFPLFVTFLFFFFFFYFFLFYWLKKWVVFAAQQVLESPSLLDHGMVAKIGCLYTSLPVQRQVLTDSAHMGFL
jgi:hypothetical protein